MLKEETVESIQDRADGVIEDIKSNLKKSIDDYIRIYDEDDDIDMRVAVAVVKQLLNIKLQLV